MSLFERQVDLIVQHCADYYQVDKKMIYEEVRQKDVNRARRMAMYLAKELTHYSYPKLKIAFKRQNHTTIREAYEKTKVWVNQYKAVQDQAWDIKELLLDSGLDELAVPAGFQKSLVAQ